MLPLRRATPPALALACILGASSASAITPPGTGGGLAGTDTKARADTIDEDLVGTPRDMRTMPRAPTLPDLTHTAPELSFEHTIASVKPRSANPADARLTSHLFLFDVEAPILRWLYLGGAWGFAAARGPESSAGKFVAAQPLLFARAVYRIDGERWSLGAGFGVLPPVFSYDDRSSAQRIEAATASSLVSIVRPWDVSSFIDRNLTGRPWVDARYAHRKFVVQLRQAVDANLRTSATSCSGNAVCDRAGALQFVSISTLYFGWQPTRETAIGVEAWQVYLLKTTLPVSSGERLAYAVSPSFRFFYRWVEPAVSLLFPIGQPLLGAADSYFAMRIDLRVWFGGR